MWLLARPLVCLLGARLSIYAWWALLSPLLSCQLISGLSDEQIVESEMQFHDVYESNPPNEDHGDNFRSAHFLRRPTLETDWGATWEKVKNVWDSVVQVQVHASPEE